ncbi:hypothetical protein MHH84_18550 [Bacillus sp. FSL K6-1109]|jgi:hypothetical protein|uniref:Uncharacterized protein n=1 Tax=Bacillus licheniformis TaxID=1402 RepID=A0AB37GYN6_BACLI|nr:MULTISPECIES: hypothetical protein [Bacillus]ARW43707.1 hypothetical protein S100141_02387 [Bacillus licheniformis]ARW55071.1 hypothetical protein S100027_03077 [Bacillus licheniformis]ATI77435.1 hypothetical protein CPQ91_17045 [Bacillus licheniformis]AXF89685.1 hypothetical protein BLDA23_15840 [Bacillus licheniformis]MBW4887013.1 hypothetical protein [Bacillus sp. (in: firmicutes)]
MSFELNLAHTSILELLEKAAEKNELIYVRARQRCVGKTTALLEFARNNNYPVLTRREIARCYQLEHPDLNIIGYVDGSEVDGLYNVVCDEGVPRDAIKRLYKLGILLTGFVRVDDQAVINDDNRYSVFGGYSTEAPSKKATPLLQIELEDIDSVPRVFYKGEKITNRIAIDFEWRTGGADKVGSTYIRIKHGNDPDKALAVETKELAVGERAYE